LLFDLKLRFVYAERRNKNGYRDWSLNCVNTVQKEQGNNVMW
jgi:hypothetical protein